MLNVVLLVTCVLIVLASVLYIFFWNHLFARVLSVSIRLSLWTFTRSAVWIDLGSVHLSLLSGRVLLKDFRYHSSNQSFRIVKCQLSWRYWIRRVAEEEDFTDSGSLDLSPKKYPQCRIHISMEGFEWFIYNKTDATESILAQLGKSDLGQMAHGARRSKSASPSIDLSAKKTRYPHTQTQRERYEIPRVGHFRSVLGRLFTWFKSQLPDLDLKSLLPISMDVSKGAIHLGNHTTESLLVAQFSAAHGTFGIIQSRSKLDAYKQSLHIRFHGAIMTLVENMDYWGSVLNIGEEVYGCLPAERHELGHSTMSMVYSEFTKLWLESRSAFRFFNKRHRRYDRPDKDTKKKRNVVVEEETHVGSDFSKLEYAIDRKILDTPELDLVYYADVAGLVPEDAPTYESKSLESMDIGNGDAPPEWGIELVTFGANIHYGPWADRQRAQLQRVFFPPTFQQLTPTARLRPGDRRLCTCLKLFVEFRGATNVHIPLREASKDWQWDGKVDYPRTSRLREAASLQLRVGDKSTLKYLVPMVATNEGYTANLDLHLDAVSATTSLNDIAIMEGQSCQISSSLPSPLIWNGERTWIFNVALNCTNIYVIRDHVNLFTDLGKDWSSGPPSDFNTFVPVVYGLRVSFNNRYSMTLNANDHNVIDRPLNTHENTLITLRGHEMTANATIPSNHFRPLSNCVSFTTYAVNVGLELSLPRWNTHTLCPPEQLSNIGQLSTMAIDGSFQYYADVRPDCIDQLKLVIKSHSPRFKMLGWFVRHIMVLRENYFGSFTQYSITREYLSKIHEDKNVGDPMELKYRAGKNNVFQVQLSLFASGVIVCLPAGITGYETCVVQDDGSSPNLDAGACATLLLPELQMDLRSHDYGMELSVNNDPITISIVKGYTDEMLFHDVADDIVGKQQILISGLDISANRLFGPQPRNATYVCMWTIGIGDIKGVLTAAEAHTLLRSLRSFLHGFSDPFNAPDSSFTSTADRDATFLKVVLRSLDISWSAGDVWLKFTLGSDLDFAFNNLAGLHYRKLLSLNAPDIALQCMLVVNSGKRWLEVASCQFGLSAELYRSPSGWRADAEMQKDFLTLQDRETNRVIALREQKTSMDTCRSRNLVHIQSYDLPNAFPTSSEPSKHQRNRRSSRRHRVASWATDSDEELHYAEHDWDRHLVDSKPNVLQASGNFDDGRSSSSLDESDETDESASDASWSEDDGDAVDGSYYTRRFCYRNLCRQFSLLDKEPSAGWGATFVLMKERSASATFHPSEGNLKNGQLTWMGEGEHGTCKSDEGKNRLRVSFLKGFTIFLTPLFVTALSFLLDSGMQTPCSPELELDGLTLSIVTENEDSAGLDLELILSELRFAIVLDLVHGKPQSELSPSSRKDGGRSEGRLASNFQVHLERGHVLLGLVQEEPSKRRRVYVQCDIERHECLLGVMHVPAATRGHLASVSKTAVEIETTNIRLISMPNKLEISIGTWTTRLKHTAPEILLGTAMEVSKAAKALLKLWKSRMKERRLRVQRLMHAILDVVGDTSSIDLLSAVQPSFFVQSGRPMKLREDLNWKFLFYLRHSLTGLLESQRKDLDASASHETPLTDIEITLRSRQVPWGTENGGLSILDIPVVQSLYCLSTKTNSPTSRGVHTCPARAVSFRLNLWNLIYKESPSSPQNNIMISEFDIHMDLLTRPLIVPLNSVSPFSATARSASRADLAYGSMTIVAGLGVNSVQIAIYPTVILLLRNSIQVWKSFASKTSSVSDGRGSGASDFLGRMVSERLVICELRLSLEDFLFEAAAENLIFEISSKYFSSSTLLHAAKPTTTNPTTLDVSGNHNFGFDEIALRARTRTTSVDTRTQDDTLATIILSDASFCTVFQSHTPRGPVSRCTHHMKKLELSVPRSAIRLYHFMEQWRQDYLLGMDAMMRSLFSEIRSNPKHPSQRIPTQRPQPISITFHASLSELAVDLRVMHGTWLSWNAHDIVTYAKSAFQGHRMNHEFGLQIGSQYIRIASQGSSYDGREGIPKPIIELLLPSVRTIGTYSSEHLELIVLVGIFHITIKPSHWDALLSVQQKFGRDFNDLLLLVSDTRRKRSQSMSKASPKPNKPRTPYNIEARSEGFRIGFEGISSIQYLECNDIDATFSNVGSRLWFMTLSNAALYLSPKQFESSKTKSTFGRKLVQEYPLLINMDFQASSSQGSIAEPKGSLELSITRFHAIMQPNSISEVSDFIDYLQSEVLLRKEQRAVELSEFKDKARKVMQTFNVRARVPSTASSVPVFGGRSIKVSMNNFGVAFPLDLKTASEVPSLHSGQPTHSRAFLITIASLNFQTQQGERGQAIMKGFSFQFVPRFRASVSDDFSSDRHQTLNKLLYPEMTVRVWSDTSSSSRNISVVAEISGFILDLDPSITGYVFSLVDIYRQGRERVEKLAAGLPRSITDTDIFSPADELPLPVPQNRKILTTVQASSKFLSGTVRMHLSPATDMSHSTTFTTDLKGRTSEIVDPEAEIFKLPELSVWVKYGVIAHQRDEEKSQENSTDSPVLIFKATIHSSYNVLRPSLLPFVTEIVQSIEERMKKVSGLGVPRSPMLQRSPSSFTSDSSSYWAQTPSKSLEMIFSLRIDQSHLELTCKPDANVLAGLHWNSGGFVVSVAPGAKGVSITGTIGGLTASLKHGFLTEDCANLDAQNLNFSINFSKSLLSSVEWINAVSIVVDTEFSGNVRFSRLQDFLCFKAVWLDHIPLFGSDSENSSSLLSKSTSASTVGAAKQGFDTAILLHIRQIKLEADLGQSISTVTLELQSARSRTRLTESVSEIAVSVGQVEVSARGNLSGHLRMPDFLFRTVRRRHRSRSDTQELSKMLELSLTTGTLDAQLQSDWLWLLQYRAEPLEAVVYDDWAMADPTSGENRQLRFFFSVNGKKVVALMTIMAIPKLVMYAGKFMANLEAQREGASRESSAFRSTRFPKPENALSEVANAMFKAARSKLKKSETLSYVIGQHMELNLNELVFVVLPRSQGDNEIARFIGINVSAQLDRTVHPNNLPTHRDLRLSLSHMSISQLLKHGFDPHQPGQDMDVLTSSARNASAGNVIFSLPSMDMRMITDEEFQSGSQTLSYDFDSKFVRLDGQRSADNISISFNLALYSWLTVLRKTLARELKRAQEAAEYRTGAESPPNPHLTITDTPDSANYRPGVGRITSPSEGSPSSPPRMRSRSSDRVGATSSSKAGLPRTLTQTSLLRTDSPELRALTFNALPGSPAISSIQDEKAQISPEKTAEVVSALEGALKKTGDIVYVVRSRRIERLTVRQLGEATPDVMHPFFTKKAGFNLEESLPQFVHEYATLPIEQIMKFLVKLYGKQLRSGTT